MSGLRTITSIFPRTGLPSLIDDVPAGSLAGGAVVPGDQCLCNCGRIADLDLGQLNIDYDDGINPILRDYDRRSGFDWLDDSPAILTDGGLRSANVGAGLYVAFLWYGATCSPEGLVLVDDPTGGDTDPALRRIRLGANGSATAFFSTFDGGGGGGFQDGISLERPGIRYADFAGAYTDTSGGLTIASQFIRGWREYAGFPF